MERITDQAVAAAESYFTRRVSEVRKVIASAEDFDGASRGLLELASGWTPNALSALLSDALELSALEARESVFVDMDGEEAPAFADTQVTSQSFREQIDFLTQKRPKPTRAWTDAMHGDHDRAFVVAGVTNMAMLEEFQAAVIAGAETYDYKAFAGEFDRLVEKYGWSYNGGREWRIRTIFETNIRTSYMAGRLRQMRDPETVKLLPYWQYRHAETRVPLEPRPLHLSWDGLVLMWDDPWWDVHFPPNDWACSCGVKAISRGQLKRMGKSGPDKAPETRVMPYHHRNSGQTVDLPEGVGFGWNYMPGDLWERGLVPSTLIDDPQAIMLDGRGQHMVAIDQASSIEDLLGAATPFKASPMEAGLPPEDYVSAYLEPFGASLGEAVLWEDRSGTKLVISDQIFRNAAGDWKGSKRGHFDHAPLLAEAIMDPDEIWMGVRSFTTPDDAYEDLRVTRRYIKVDPKTSLFALFEIGRNKCIAVTGYASFNRSKPDYRHIDKQRVGKLVWKKK